MWNRITRVYKDILYLTIIIGLIHLIIANLVFAFRHPWATDMERFLHIGDALMFNKVSYKEMRGMYDKE